MDKVLAFSKKLLKEVIDKNSIVVDATAGNGNDTLFLAKTSAKRVFAFDVQNQATTNTNDLLEKNNLADKCEIILDSHENFDKYIEENIATVSGIEAMYDQNNLKLLITDTLKKFIENFPIDKIDLLSSKDLAYWVKEVKEIPNLKNKIDTAIKFCVNFLTFENLLPFEKIIEKQEEVAEWHNFLNSLKTLPSVKID